MKGLRLGTAIGLGKFRGTPTPQIRIDRRHSCYGVRANSEILPF